MPNVIHLLEAGSRRVIVEPEEGDAVPVVVNVARRNDDQDGGCAMVIFVNSFSPLDDAGMDAAVIAALGPPKVKAEKKEAS